MRNYDPIFVFISGSGQAFWLQLQLQAMSTCIPFIISSLKPSKFIMWFYTLTTQGEHNLCMTLQTNMKQVREISRNSLLCLNKLFVQFL